MAQSKKSFPEVALPIAVAACFSLFCTLHSRAAQADDGYSATTTAPATPSSQGNPSGEANPENAQWAVQGQLTNTTQWHPPFRSPYSGSNSLEANGRTEETTDLTLFAGVRLWRGAELWLNPEIDQGSGLSNTFGVAGYPSGEAYKVGANVPYPRLPRVFIRQVISLGGEDEKVESSENQFAGVRTSNNVTLTVGRFSVVDIFDTNSYAHDPRADFMNWSVIDAGAFDYAADVWGYTYGATAEWTQDWWTLRGGVFQLSSVPNAKITRVDFSQYSLIGEFEARHQWLGHPGKVKLLAFVNRAPMASYADAVQLAHDTGGTPDVSLVRHYSSRPGVVLNVEQELSSDLGAFARLSASDGSKEAYEFTDIDRSLSAGLSLKGDRWGRHDDTLGIAAVVNTLSGAAQAYFAAGGLGLLIGDGALNYAPEKIVEMVYSLHVDPHIALSFDYQYITNPAYNRDRGPVSVCGVRLHADF